MKGQFYSVVSGFLAALASLSGKFAMAYDEALWLCEVVSRMTVDNSSSASCVYFVPYIRVSFFALMLLLNTAMWTTFVKALRFSSTSLEATVTNTAANFLFTAIFGLVIFEEFLSLMWWLGLVFIIVGLVLMHLGNSQSTVTRKRKRN